MSNPFDESDDDTEPIDRSEGLTINKSFADKFESAERKKDLLRAKEILDDDDASDSESEDDDGEIISSSLDLKILKVINKIRKKDPEIYDKTTTWFEKRAEFEDGDSDDDNDPSGEEKPTSVQKKKRFKDVLREQLLKHGADIEQDDDKGNNNNRISSTGRVTSALAYDAEQQKLRKEFLKSVGGDGDDDDDDDDVFQVRAKNPAEHAQEEIDLKNAMTEMRELGQAEAAEETTKSDSFLLDYISKQSWKSKQKFSTRDEEKDDSSGDDYEEDEEELDKVDLFEHKYNFRFEELQGQDGAAGSSRSNVIGMGLQSLQVMGHARSVEGSLRRVDEKRKGQRESRKAGKEKEKRQKEAELMRLKSLKNQELQERLRQICEVSGVVEGSLGLGEMDLDEDWDPVKYEAMMQSQFGDDYYGNEDNGAFTGAGGEGEEGWDVGNIDGMGEEGEEEYYDAEGEGEGEGEEEEFDDGTGQTTTKSKVVSDMLDELYKLDYEDIIAGMPCRFKYRQVEKEGFGLSADEILLADDTELNKFVSLKKISAYSEPYGAGEQAHKVAKKRKRLRVAIKERLQKEAEDAAAAGLEIKGLKSKKTADVEAEEVEISEEVGGKDAEAAQGAKKRRRRKLKEDTSTSLPVAASSQDKPLHNLDEASLPDVVKSKSSSNQSRGAESNSKTEKVALLSDDKKKRKKKSTAMGSAPTAKVSSGNNASNGSNNSNSNSNSKTKSKSKNSSTSENQQRRASLYK